MNGTDDRLAEQVRANIPKYLILICEQCLRPRKINDFRVERPVRGKFKDKLTVYGTCRKCGEEIRASIDTESDLRVIALRTERYFENLEGRKAARAKKRKVTKNMPKTKKTSKKAVEAEAKTTKKAKAKTTAVKGTKKTTKVKAASNGTRERVYIRDEGHPTQQVAFMMIMSGGMWTLEELQDRHDKLADKDVIGRRTKALSKTDFSFMTGPRVGSVEMPDGKEHEAYRSKNSDGEDVFGAPTLPDALKKGAKAGKVTTKKGQPTFAGMQLVKRRGDLNN